MRRAARAWAAGSHCGMCPLAPQYPAECIQPEPIVWRGDIEEEPGRECPVFLGKEFEKFFFGWNQLEKGILPTAGGWAEQPAYWMQAFEIIGPSVAEAQRERMKNMKSIDH